MVGRTASVISPFYNFLLPDMLVRYDYPRLPGTSKCFYSKITPAGTQNKLLRCDYIRDQPVLSIYLCATSECLYSTIRKDQPVLVKACLAQPLVPVNACTGLVPAKITLPWVKSIIFVIMLN